MNHHIHTFEKCKNHTCDTCKFEESREIPCVCCYNDGGIDNCYWEPKDQQIEKENNLYKGFTITCNNCGSLSVWIDDNGIECCQCHNKEYGME